MITNLFKRLIFKLYFVICSAMGGRDAGISRWFARQIVSKVGFVPMHRDGIYLGLNPCGFIDWCLMARGGFEPVVKSVIQESLKDGGVMLDIGANIGLHTLIMSKAVGASGKVIALEPHPIIVKKIRQNLTYTRWDKR